MRKEINVLLVDADPSLLAVVELAAQGNFPEASFIQVYSTAHARAYIDGLTTSPSLFIIVNSEPGDSNSGFHFLAFLKARKLPFMAPVFMLTDHPTKDDTVDAHQFGAASYVAKPDNAGQWEQYLALIRLHYVYSL